MTNGVSRDVEGRDGRPLALEYAERVPLEQRQGQYDTDNEVWVVRKGATVVPLVRASRTTLEETVSKTRTDPTDVSRPRRGASLASDGRSAAGVDRSASAMEETGTRVRAEATDPAAPRRGRAFEKEYGHGGTGQNVLGETKTSAKSDPEDRPRPRRSAAGRRPPEETLTFVDDEGTDEARPRRSGH